MHTLIEIQFLTISDTDRFAELFTDTPNEAFELSIGPKESSMSWKTEGDFYKHFHLIWQDKLFNAWISRKEMFGVPMFLFYCAEYRSKEWWASFTEGSFPNDGGRSFQIQDGKSVAVAHSNKRTLEVSGDKNHIRLEERNNATKLG
jgi:hypothetical protein